MKNFWDERYSTKEYIYGVQPNQFFKEQLNNLKPGKILMVGEGEGRNAVYAAQLGWRVDAIDSSSVAKEKALRLAKQNSIVLNYFTTDITAYDFTKGNYDAIGIIFLHMNKSDSKNLHKKCISALCNNGKVILELFSKNQFGKTSGGPQDLSMLYSLEQIGNNFLPLKHELLREENILLSEGEFHHGEASVVRFVGVK